MKNFNNKTLPQIQQELIESKLTCVEIVEWYLSNINSKKHLNALLEVYDDEALLNAKLIDEKIKSNTQGVLAGLVVTLKDVISHKNHMLGAASRILDGFEAQFNATIVERLLSEDAIVIGKNNCDEFAMGSSNENSSFGKVLNDVDNERVPGGSSGGSAVAVQADMCSISIGSDTGGSVRLPASFCGIIGFKPTYSRISRHGLIAYASSFDCIGILGKNMVDIAIVLNVIAGKDEFDSTVSTKNVPNYIDNIHHVKKRKIAYITETINDKGLDNEIKEHFEIQTELLKNEGHLVDEISFNLLDYILPTYYILTTAEASSNLSRYDGIKYGYRSNNDGNLENLYKKTRTEGFGKEVKKRIMLGTFVLSSDYYDAFYDKAQKARRLIREKTKEIFKAYDFVITPTTSTPAFKLNEFDADPLAMYLTDLYTVQASIGGFPAISIPTGKNLNNLPIGTQIMADDFEEEQLLSFSKSMLELNHKK